MLDFNFYNKNTWWISHDLKCIQLKLTQYYQRNEYFYIYYRQTTVRRHVILRPMYGILNVWMDLGMENKSLKQPRKHQLKFKQLQKVVIQLFKHTILYKSSLETNLYCNERCNKSKGVINFLLHTNLQQTCTELRTNLHTELHLVNSYSLQDVFISCLK